MAKLWTKDGTAGSLPEVVERFCFAEDIRWDARLAYYDALGSIAHARMLGDIGILSTEELAVMEVGLRRLWREFDSGVWHLEVSDEDIHTAYESRLGAAGEKLHTARSRNDQVLLDMRLFGKERMLEAALTALSFGEACLDSARRNAFQPLPGYTHLQRAMPSSWGMWMGSFSEATLDALTEMEMAYTLLDRSPLGSGAGYGVPLAINREVVARLLGFARVQRNPIHCQNSRGATEAVALSALASASAAAGRLATDVCLFASREFGFVRLPDALITGSSIMPQKRNPDLFELVRPKVVRLSALEQRVRLTPHGLGSGYSKDLQEVKGAVMEGYEVATDTLAVMAAAVPGLQPEPDAIAKALTPELYAAHAAFALVREGVPFRQAYRRVKEHPETVNAVVPQEALRAMTHTGATGNLGLDDTAGELARARSLWEARRQNLHAAWKNLLPRSEA